MPKKAPPPKKPAWDAKRGPQEPQRLVSFGMSVLIGTCDKIELPQFGGPDTRQLLPNPAETELWSPSRNAPSYYCHNDENRLQYAKFAFPTKEAVFQQRLPSDVVLHDKYIAESQVFDTSPQP
jgi:hypothetical protein